MANGNLEPEKKFKLEVLRDLVHAHHGLMSVQGKEQYNIIRNIWSYEKLSVLQKATMQEGLESVGLRVANYDSSAKKITPGFPATEDAVSLIYDRSFVFGKMINLPG